MRFAEKLKLAAANKVLARSESKALEQLNAIRNNLRIVIERTSLENGADRAMASVKSHAIGRNMHQLDYSAPRDFHRISASSGLPCGTAGMLERKLINRISGGAR